LEFPEFSQYLELMKTFEFLQLVNHFKTHKLITFSNLSFESLREMKFLAYVESVNENSQLESLELSSGILELQIKFELCEFSKIPKLIGLS